jgi:hypothetical protein
MSAIPLLTDVVDKRKEYRLATAGRALMHVIDAQNRELIGIAFHVDVINVSASGIRVAAEQVKDLMDGGTFEMWIGADGSDQKLYLNGDIRWVSWEENNEFQMGIEILDRLNTDVDKWRDLHG